LETPPIMTPSLKDICSATIRVEDLPVLAELRDRSEIRVSIVGDRAWIWWKPETEAMQEILIKWILPLPGVEMFTEVGGRWYRWGKHLPAFGVSVPDDRRGVPLDRIVLPRPVSAQRPEGRRPARLRVGVVRDQRCRSRPATGVCWRLSELHAWAEQATSAQFAGLTAAWTEGPVDERGEAEVLVLGRHGSLPAARAGVRFWGTDVLVPLGFRADPDLAEPALKAAVGAGPTDLVVLRPEGFDVIARAIFQPLDRAGVRLAWEAITADQPWEGNRS
jgi:MoxR-vWA-beta-propeller ternary system domain bpX2